MSPTPATNKSTVKHNILVKAKQQRRRVKTIHFVTGNKNKLLETSAILSDTIPSLASIAIDLPELQGEPEDIARAKCALAIEKAGPGHAVITEDTSLCMNALGGLPGPFIKYFLEKLGHDGINKMLHGFEDKTAYALCIFSYCDDVSKQPKIFVGKCPGKIVPPRYPEGTKPFGWDPIFQPDGFDLTFAEMTKEQKNTISHRLRALDEFKAFIGENYDNVILGDVLPDGENDLLWEQINTESI